MTAKLLTEHHLEFLSFKGGFIGLPESTPVKMPHCWKSRRGSYVVLGIVVFTTASAFTLVKVFVEDFEKLYHMNLWIKCSKLF